MAKKTEKAKEPEKKEKAPTGFAHKKGATVSTPVASGIGDEAAKRVSTVKGAGIHVIDPNR